MFRSLLDAARIKAVAPYLSLACQIAAFLKNYGDEACGPLTHCPHQGRPAVLILSVHVSTVLKK